MVISGTRLAADDAHRRPCWSRWSSADIIARPLRRVKVASRRDAFDSQLLETTLGCRLNRRGLAPLRSDAKTCVRYSQPTSRCRMVMAPRLVEMDEVNGLTVDMQAKMSRLSPQESAPGATVGRLEVRNRALMSDTRVGATVGGNQPARLDSRPFQVYFSPHGTATEGRPGGSWPASGWHGVTANGLCVRWSGVSVEAMVFDSSYGTVAKW